MEVQVRIDEMVAEMEARERLSRADFRRRMGQLVAISLGRRGVEAVPAGP